MNHSYWHIQTTEKPLFPDIEWNKPERRLAPGPRAQLLVSKALLQ